MAKHYSAELLRRLRNEIPIDWLIAFLRWPHKRREGRIVFVCPVCQESESDVNPKTNLARCFRCERNFNPIEFTMATQVEDFIQAVEFLKPLLRN